MTPGTIETRGSATHWVPAEHVDITFTVRRRAATSALAASGASRSFVDLEDALHAHAEVVMRRTTQSLTVRTAQQLNRKTGAWTDSGFEAQRSMTVRLGPVERAGAALRQVLAQVTDVTVSGPVFGVSPDHPARAMYVRRRPRPPTRRPSTSPAAWACASAPPNGWWRWTTVPCRWRSPPWVGRWRTKPVPASLHWWI